MEEKILKIYSLEEAAKFLGLAETPEMLILRGEIKKQEANFRELYIKYSELEEIEVEKIENETPEAYKKAQIAMIILQASLYYVDGQIGLCNETLTHAEIYAQYICTEKEIQIIEELINLDCT